MAINDDFSNKAEREMKLHEAKMMEQAMIRKLMTAPLAERITFALSKTGQDPNAALTYMKDHQMIQEGESVSPDDLKSMI